MTFPHALAVSATRVHRKRNGDRAKEIAKQEARKIPKTPDTKDTKVIFILEDDAAI